MNVELTEQQKEKIIEIYESGITNLNEITQKVYRNKKLDGRSKEGRGVRDFLVKAGKVYKTTKFEKKEFFFTDEQEKYIEENCKESLMEIAKVLFPEEEIKTPLDSKCRYIDKYIKSKKLRKNFIEDDSDGRYVPPKKVKDLITKVNIYANQDLCENELSAKSERCIKSLAKYLQTPLFIRKINTYTDEDDRVLMESEFIRYTWNKYDLTAEDLTMYIGVCVDIIRGQVVSEQKEALDRQFEESTSGEGGEAAISMRLSESINAITQEFNQIQKRIETSITKLQKDRSKRMDDLSSQSANFLSLVESFQEEKERKIMLTLAEAQRLKVRAEVDRLESLPEFKARIFGLSKDEAI